MNNYTQNLQNPNKKPANSNRNNSMVRVVSTVVLAVLAVLIIVGACLGCYFGGRNAEINYNMKDDLAIANEVYTLIKENYYMDITKEEFNKWAALGLSSAMDQFSNLSYTSTLPSLQFGISIKSDSYNNHVITYISKSVTLDKTPAEIAQGVYLDNNERGAKLERGDLLVSVDGRSVQGLTTDVLNGPLFFGKATDKVAISIVVQKSDGRKAEFVLKKDYITSNYSNYMNLGSNIGYIKLNSFTGINDEINAATEFAACAEQFKKNSNHKLILDLRDNGGGSVSLLASIASYLIHDDKGNSNGLNVIKLDSNKGTKHSYCTAEGNNWIGKGISDYKLVVLVNENSASASEALLGAISYYCPEATIIGAPTYGKGIAQQTYQLVTTPDYLLSITIGYFYVPVSVNGKQDWKTYHGQSMMPSSDNLTVEKFSNLIDFTEDNVYKDYYNNDIKEEKAIKLALDVLLK